ncbi:MAG: EamA family transporter [Vallitaleaceae bacterium]|nr:EamA family transporter [Vallitaleaceae bacterium]
MFLPLILIITILGAFAGMFLKTASNSSHGLLILKKKSLYAGIILYLSAASVNVYLLKYFDYSQVFPSTSMTYIWTLIISAVFLKEQITVRKVVGILFIITGVIVITL